MTEQVGIINEYDGHGCKIQLKSILNIFYQRKYHNGLTSIKTRKRSMIT